MLLHRERAPSPPKDRGIYLISPWCASRTARPRACLPLACLPAATLIRVSACLSTTARLPCARPCLAGSRSSTHAQRCLASSTSSPSSAGVVVPDYLSYTSQDFKRSPTKVPGLLRLARGRPTATRKTATTASALQRAQRAPGLLRLARGRPTATRATATTASALQRARPASPAHMRTLSESSLL